MASYALRFSFIHNAEVVGGLVKGGTEVFSARFVLDNQHALPQQVDVAATAVGLLDRLLEGGDATARNAEYLEERVPEALGFGVFGDVFRPFPEEGQGVAS